MGNSTITLQKVMDTIAAVGDISAFMDQAGGWADEPALTIGNDVMKELLGIRFPWKWNRLKLPPFPLTSLQQDYAFIDIKNIGWLENGLRIDVNNTCFPAPTWPIYAVRDLQMTHMQAGFPYQFCWFYNRDLEFAPWPGPEKEYTEPIQAKINPKNPPTHIRNSQGHILVLQTFGTTGDTEPLVPPWDPANGPRPPNYPTWAKIEDGTCMWIVADPDAQGLRFNPIPPRGGNVWLVRAWAQKKAPTFCKLGQLIDPIPDDEVKWFRDGCVAYAHRYAANPAVKARYPQAKAEWIAGMEMECKQNDREDEAKGFFPDKGVMSPSYVTDPGPYPFRYGWRN